MRDARPWTDHEDRKLTQLWATDLPKKVIADKLGRTPNAIIGRVFRLKLPSGARKTIKIDWTPADDARLKAMWEHLSANEIARRTGHSDNTIRRRAGILGLKPKPSGIASFNFARKQAGNAKLTPAVAPATPSVKRVRARASGPTSNAYRDCQYPIGDPRSASFRFCGEPVTVLGRPYCLAHCKVAYQSSAAG